jgi:hypothetical protein
MWSGVVRLNNMMFVNLCTVPVTIGASLETNALLSGVVFGFDHEWSRSIRALYAKNSVMLVPRSELEMMTYW